MKKLALLALPLLAACGTPTEATSKSTTEAPSGHEVMIGWSGDDVVVDATITVGDTKSQRNGLDNNQSAGPFTLRRGDFVYVSVQTDSASQPPCDLPCWRRGGYRHEINCYIEVDGVRVEEQQSSGKFTIATCSGRI